MLNVEQISAKIEREGQNVTFRRKIGTQTVSATVKAFIRGYRPMEIGDGIQQGDREMRVAPSALYYAGFPGQPKNPDRIEIEENTAVVQSVELRFLRGEPCVYIMQVRGG